MTQSSNHAFSFQIQSVPTVVAFKGGKPVLTFSGAIVRHIPSSPRALTLPLQPEASIQEFINEVLAK